MKWIAIAASAIWAGIVGLSWWLAEQRLHHCSNWEYDDSAFVMRALSARDATLISGLKGYLFGAAALALMAWGASILRGRRTNLAPYLSSSPSWHGAATAGLRIAGTDGRRLSWPIAGVALLAGFVLGWLSSASRDAGNQTQAVEAQVDPARQIALDAAAGASDAANEAMAAAAEAAASDQPVAVEAGPAEEGQGE